MALPYITPNTFKQGSIPTTNQHIYNRPEVDDLWVDTSSHLVKRCTSTDPYTWVSIESSTGTTVFVDSEIPAGVIDGVNDTFTLSGAPFPGSSLMLFSNSLLLIQGVHYTLSGLTITMLVPPVVDDYLVAWFRQ